MSIETSSGLHPALALGDVLPETECLTSHTHLYVSLSDLIMEHIFYHPNIECDSQKLDEVESSSIRAILGEVSLEDHFVATLTQQIHNAIKPEHQAIRVCLSNADSYSFNSLIGGGLEEHEVNPALGVRGVSRYAKERFRTAFILECKVIKALQEQGIDVQIVVPFVRTMSDAAKVIDLLAEQGLPRGLNGLKVHYSADVPSSALLAEKLLHYFDGMVINLENLAQFTLGIDRFNEHLEYLYDPQNETIVELIDMASTAAASVNKPVVITSSRLIEYPKIQEYIVEHKLDAVVTM
ncbi:putative PEP-binding protein [Vibrio japonicus]|uniref:Phosphoenolpyruvate synthase n=1 Tax=Vibrio japonicus TaxID=1824638 RepID=A0ABY5LBK4_9VIBR|nr:putative PEP-binding protein [Vibrio japonicus]UUM29428.1 phosphoenolpyruvate synthase [Vibrio japonicus]